MSELLWSGGGGCSLRFTFWKGRRGRRTSGAGSASGYTCGAGAAEDERQEAQIEAQRGRRLSSQLRSADGPRITRKAVLGAQRRLLTGRRAIRGASVHTRLGRRERVRIELLFL